MFEALSKLKSPDFYMLQAHFGSWQEGRGIFGFIQIAISVNLRETRPVTDLVDVAVPLRPFVSMSIPAILGS